jgi:hypothetical protein
MHIHLGVDMYAWHENYVYTVRIYATWPDNCWLRAWLCVDQRPAKRDNKRWVTSAIKMDLSFYLRELIKDRNELIDHACHSSGYLGRHH